jgi:hypothetical protein
MIQEKDISRRLRGNREILTHKNPAVTNESSKTCLEKITFLMSNSFGIWKEIKCFLIGNVQKPKFFRI